MGVTTQVLNEVELDSTRFYHYDSLLLILYVSKIQELAAARMPHLFFISSANACSPLEPYTNDKVKSVTLVAKSAASDSSSIQIESGDTLNRYLVVDYLANNTATMDTIFPIIITSNKNWFFKWGVKPARPINIYFSAHVLLDNGKQWLVDNLSMRVQ
jgi:hypothetical protein